MKQSEAIEKYQREITDELVSCYRIVLNYYGRIQYKVYVWEDGEIETLQGVQGDNSWLQPRSAEPRKLFYVCTVDAPCFDPWDFADHAAPDDEDEREAERKEIIDYLVGEYEHNVSEVIETAIEEAKDIEAWD